MKQVSTKKDLSIRLETHKKDEVYQLTEDINTLLDNVADSLAQVQRTSHSLALSATQLTGVARDNDNAANNQQIETVKSIRTLSSCKSSSKELKMRPLKLPL